MSEPIAWGIASDGRLLASYTCADEDSAREMAGRLAASGVSVNVVPLYRQPAMTAAEREALEWYAAWVHEVVPLYRSPTLTEAEREAVQVARDAYADDDGNAECEQIAAVLSRLLERLK